MMTSISNLIFVALAASLPYQMVSAAPSSSLSLRDGTDSEPATVYFTPMAFVGCRQSQDPHDNAQPDSYNVTTASGCVNSAYYFASYVESASSAAVNGPCTFNIYSEANCTGAVGAGARTSYGDCVTDGSSSGWSVSLVCGP